MPAVIEFSVGIEEFMSSIDGMSEGYKTIGVWLK